MNLNQLTATKSRLLPLTFLNWKDMTEPLVVYLPTSYFSGNDSSYPVLYVQGAPKIYSCTQGIPGSDWYHQRIPLKVFFQRFFEGIYYRGHRQ
jgi:hypothetical protein